LSVAPAREVDQDVAHLLAGDGEKMPAAFHFAFFAANLPQVSLVNQRRSLKNVVRPLSLHLPGGDAVKLR
jgi:hypothetical protein